MAYLFDDTGSHPAAAAAQERKISGRGWLALATGLNLAFAVCYIICKPPRIHTLSWRERLTSSLIYLLVACATGAFGTWVALPRTSRSNQFRTLSRCGIRAWVFFPAIALFLQTQSVLGPALAVVSAALMAIFLWRSTDAIPDDTSKSAPTQQGVEQSLFVTEVPIAPSSWVPFIISLCLYAAFLAAVDERNVLATILLAAVTFLLVFHLFATQALKRKRQSDDLNRRSHPYFLIAAAFFCAIVALSASSIWRDPLLNLSRGIPHPAPPKQQSPTGDSSSGYQAIVLWPIQKPDKIIPSPPVKTNKMSAGTAKPWIIPFDGPYWYFKFVGETPGPHAHTTHGDPLKVNIHSSDPHPLLMEAHQYLSEPVNISCCRELQVVFRNDAALGALAVGVSLTDSHSPGKLSQNLGVKYVVPNSTDSNHASQHPANTSSIEETLTFIVPKSAIIKQFDAITVTLLAASNHLTAARKVAVERFVMIPN
jgi:hypothetical protein